MSFWRVVPVWHVDTRKRCYAPTVNGRICQAAAELLLHAAQTWFSGILRAGDAVDVEDAVDFAHGRQQRVEVLRLGHFEGWHS